MYVDMKKIETVEEFKYLGVMLYNDATKPNKIL
jgi:hypothetical protein